MTLVHLQSSSTASRTESIRWCNIGTLSRTAMTRSAGAFDRRTWDIVTTESGGKLAPQFDRLLCRSTNNADFLGSLPRCRNAALSAARSHRLHICTRLKKNKDQVTIDGYSRRQTPLDRQGNMQSAVGLSRRIPALAVKCVDDAVVAVTRAGFLSNLDQRLFATSGAVRRRSRCTRRTHMVF
jgi:hypothetical protein